MVEWFLVAGIEFVPVPAGVGCGRSCWLRRLASSSFVRRGGVTVVCVVIPSFGLRFLFLKYSSGLPAGTFKLFSLLLVFVFLSSRFYSVATGAAAADSTSNRLHQRFCSSALFGFCSNFGGGGIGAEDRLPIRHGLYLVDPSLVALWTLCWSCATVSSDSCSVIDGWSDHERLVLLMLFTVIMGC